jgi:PPOX class probable F420-dependent enzyme
VSEISFPPPTSTPFGERVARRLREEKLAWLTVGADGTPQPNPVWFLWEGDTILIYSMTHAARVANIKHMPRIFLRHWLANGMRQHIANYITEVYNQHEGMEHVPEEVKRMGGTPDEISMANRAARFNFADPQRLLEYMPHILHVHGKFNDMVEDNGSYREEAIPYEEVVPVLIDGGYSGYISSEYEGNAWIEDDNEVDSVDQVRRHQTMLRRLLDGVGQEGSSAKSPALAERQAQR